MQTIAPTESAVTYAPPPVLPMSRKIRQVKSSVATVMPEIGLEDEPISPVSREDTVTNRKPNTMMSSAPRKFMCSAGVAMMPTMRTIMPMPTKLMGRSRSVRGTKAAVSARVASARPERKSRRPALRPCQIVGSERTRLMRPPAATAPAPM